MVKTSRYLSLVLLFLSSFLFANDSFENKEIADVQIKIDNAKDKGYDTQTILTKLSTQKGLLFSQRTFDSDLKKLSDEFDRIEPSFEVKDDKIYITIKLWARPTIVKITFHGNKIVSTSKLQKELGIKPFSIFNKAKFNAALNKVNEYYVKKGYFETQISFKENQVAYKNEVKIDIFVKEGKSGKIQNIYFEGFTKEEQTELIKAMQTRKYNLLTSWITDTGTYKEEAADQDKMNIINFLQNKGYADAKVDIKIFEIPQSGKIIITIIAHRGTLYRFGKITFEGNCLLTNDEIINSFLVHPGEIFSPDKIRATTNAIKDAYGTKGYIDANIYFDTHLQENEPIFNVNFYIDEGEEYKIGLIKIYGNKTTKPNVILRESLLVPGQKFDSRKLKATEQRLENIGYFKNVNVYAVQSSDESLGPNYRDVHIEVDEESTGHLSFSAALSSTDNVSGTVDITENNFDHTGLYKMFRHGPSSLRGGGEYAQLKGTIGKRQSNYSATWMNPYFRDSLWKLGFEFSGTHSRLQSKDYRIRTLGGSAYTAYPFSTFWSIGIRYRLRNSDNIVKNKLIKATPKDDREQLIKDNQKDSEGLISGAGPFLSYDSTDNSYKPHRGLRSNLEAEYVGLGGKYDFLKLSYINTYYYPLWLKGTMKYRFNLTFLDPFTNHKKKINKEVPISERLFLGGEKTVRGYKPYIIGPQMTPDEAKDDPKGGISSMLLSVEYNQEIIKPLVDIFFFADAGAVSFKQYNIKRPRASVGLGLRLEVMNRVPITIGWGYPINPKRGNNDKQSLFFYMGGQF
ncbi:MAG: Outer membrane protein assembly factor BamA [Candidatus Anoxychlamydiales bacterium]|nr:Outer membrane protein assembly factor BamA [Candidatus Anoxychlamydiales bacterium]HEU64184.1 outer membrane protein assembly factor BamA [Chlamydiota bacterium]